ncbi:mannosylphosphorylation protein [Emericellopsis atlantica]|uniref:Mannosylphosphorylation protein n=1 Tax=Emericellopsis atlantica TaxID=2614577 RepID=A0A9P7ZMI8_9HYPO|nr:mannosylphosphorylation protein [Emericellopsis atlantica]KAG9254854.1 mannosylphosphorylation protein [Emericellopsis atlantica]
MRFSTFLTLAVSATAAAATPFLKATEFLNPKPPNLMADNVPEPKYFREASLNGHCDYRFYKADIDEAEHQEGLRLLVQTYLHVCNELKIQTWLMHGSLLGWWWGKKIMPWDLDVDVQVTESDMYYLAAYYNRTEFYYVQRGTGQGRTYLLDVNPHHVYRGRDDKLNVIDARWIDTTNGLYIDITAARYDLDHEQGEGMLYDKHNHEYRDTYIFPLLETTFEGVTAKIPYKYKDMLISEYTVEGLTDKEYHGHVFDEEEMKWVKAGM